MKVVRKMTVPVITGTNKQVWEMPVEVWGDPNATDDLFRAENITQGKGFTGDNANPSDGWDNMETWDEE